MDTIHLPQQRPAGGPASGAGSPASEPGWSRVLLVAGSRAALVMLLSLVVWSVLPGALGWSPRVIMSGSMMSRIHVGDVVVDRPFDPATLTEGRIITVVDPDHLEKTRSRRFQELNTDGDLVTMGDANDAADSTPVKSDDVLGLAAIRVPYVGSPVTWATQGQFVPLAITSTLLLLLGLVATTPLRLPVPALRPHEDDGDDEGPDDSRSEGRDDDASSGRGADEPASGRTPKHESASTGSARRGPRVVAMLAAATVAAIGMTLPTTGAAFSATTLNAANTFSAAASFTPYRDDVIGDVPQVYWRFEASSSSAVDDSTSNNNNGLIAGNVNRSVAGALTSEAASTAIGYTGSGLVTERNSTTTSVSTFAMELWVRTTSRNGGALLSFGNGSGQNASSTLDRVLYLSRDGRVRFGVDSNKTVIASTSTVNNGAWHHVVATYVTGTNGMKLYVDGTLQAQGRGTANLTSGYWRSGGESMTGWSNNPSVSLVNAEVDEAAVYSGRLLSATQVTSHYRTATTP